MKGEGTYVNHDCLEARLAKGADRADRAPIELDRRTDAVHSRAKHHDTVVVERDVMFAGVVSEVEVVGEGRELGSDGVDLLHEGGDTRLETHATYGELSRTP